MSDTTGFLQVLQQSELTETEQARDLYNTTAAEMFEETGHTPEPCLVGARLALLLIREKKTRKEGAE
jgi:hypothetical protein